MKLELFKGRPEAFFLMPNNFLSLNEFLLFQFDPLRVKPETLLDLNYVTMEVV